MLPIFFILLVYQPNCHHTVYFNVFYNHGPNCLTLTLTNKRQKKEKRGEKRSKPVVSTCCSLPLAIGKRRAMMSGCSFLPGQYAHTFRRGDFPALTTGGAVVSWWYVFYDSSPSFSHAGRPAVHTHAHAHAHARLNSRVQLLLTGAV